MLFYRKNIRFIASLLVLGTLSTAMHANITSRSVRKQAQTAKHMLVQYKYPLMLTALAGLSVYASKRAYESISPYFRTVALLNGIIDDTLGDVAKYLHSDSEELPQSMRQLARLLASPEAQAVLHATLKKDGSSVQSDNQSPITAQILAFLATPQGLVLAQRMTDASLTTIMPAYFEYSHQLLREGRVTPGAITQIMESVLATPERREMVERMVVKAVPATVSKLQITTALLLELRVAQAAERGEVYVASNEYSLEKLAQALERAPALTARIIHTAVATAVQSNRTEQHAQTVTGRAPAASSIFWAVISYPNAIISGAFWGAMQRVVQRAQEVETGGQHVTQ